MANRSEQANTVNRRKFFIRVGNTIIGIVGAGTLGAAYKFLLPSVIKEIPPTFQIGSPDLLRPGSVIFNEDYKVFVVRDEQGQIYAISAICTHLGCTVNWRQGKIIEIPEAAISCPCHGSMYDQFGNVLRGPAQRPLDRFDIRLKNNILVVDTAKIIELDAEYLTL